MGNRHQTMPKIFYDKKVIALTYHHIDPEANKKDKYTILPSLFSEHLAALIANNYHIINIDDFLKFTLQKAKIPPNAILITFDDGYESFYHYAYPELLKLGCTATNFIVVKLTDLADVKEKLPPLAYDQINNLPHLTWGQIREMKASGINFYSHTYNLHNQEKTKRSKVKPALANPIYITEKDRIETKLEYQKRIKQDFILATQRFIEELGEKPNIIAFPYGAYNREVVTIGKQVGYKVFFTTHHGINKPGQRLIYRINAGSSHISVERLLEKIRKYHDHK